MNIFILNIVTLLVVISVPVESQLPVGDYTRSTDGSKEVKEKLQKHLDLITSSAAKLKGRDFAGIPIVVQKLGLVKKTSEYNFPEQVGKYPAAIVRKVNDEGKEIIIFPIGESKFRQKANNTYIVLRKASKEIISLTSNSNVTYYLNIAYLRKRGRKTVLEWSTIEVDQFRKISIEVELCRKDDCEFPEWILGTCPIIQHNCRTAFNKRIKPMESVKEDLQNRYLTTSKALQLKVPLTSTQQPQHSDFVTPFSERFTDKIIPAAPVEYLAINKRDTGEVVRKNDLHLFEEEDEHRVPSSLDLLMKHKKNNDDTDNDVSFKDSILKTRGIVDNNNLENTALRCTQCQSIGDFFEDLEEKPLGFSKRVGELIKREYRPQAGTNISCETNLRAPFVGFGNCNYSLDDAVKPSSKEIDDIVEFYLGTLRKDCDTVAQGDMRGWITSKLKFLQIEDDLTLHMVTTSELLKSDMFSPEEFGMIMSALLVTQYTETYHQYKNIVDKYGNHLYVNPVGLEISNSCNFLTRLFLNVIDSTFRILDNHLVKSLRTIIRHLKDKFLVLLVERKRLISMNPTETSSKNCSIQKMDLLTINYNDRQQIMALKEFATYGLGPIFKSGTMPLVAFDSFYKFNQKRIEFLVKAYGFDN